MSIWMLYVVALSVLVPQASSQLCFTFIVFVVTVQNDCLLVCCCEKDELFAEIAFFFFFLSFCCVPLTGLPLV